jgi:hypothetical protein
MYQCFVNELELPTALFQVLAASGSQAIRFSLFPSLLQMKFSASRVSCFKAKLCWLTFRSKGCCYCP